MNHTVEFDSFQDFVLFLFMFMAHSDGEYHEQEQRVILNKVKKLFPKHEDPKKLVEEANVGFKQIPETQLETIIESAFRKFSFIGFHEKYRVFRDLYEIIHADGVVHQDEQEAIEKLKRIIDYEVLG
jgi:hypothetical protein